MKEIIENFGINSTFWVQLINFLVLMLAFVKWGLKPIQKVIKERQDYAKKLVGIEKEWKEKLEKIESSYNEKMAQAEEKAAKIITDAKKYAESLKKQVGEELYTYKQEEMAKFQKYLESKKNEFKTELREQIISDFKKALGDVLQEKPKLAEDITKALVAKMSMMENE